MKACCFDELAEARQEYGTVQELLYHESRFFEQAERLAGLVEEHSRPGQVIFGDASTAGLVALLAGRRLAGDFADTNTQRFSSGLDEPEDVIRMLKAQDLAFVIVQAQRVRGPARWRYGKFASLRPFRQWLERDFEVAFGVTDRTKGTYLLLRPRTAPPADGQAQRGSM